MRINPKYWQDRQEELRRYDFKMGRQLRDLLPDVQILPVIQTPRQEDSTPLYNRINQLQAELNFTRNKLNEHLDKAQNNRIIKTSGRI
jgi:hypothetical protein